MSKSNFFPEKCFSRQTQSARLKLTAQDSSGRSCSKMSENGWTPGSRNFSNFFLFFDKKNRLKTAWFCKPSSSLKKFLWKLLFTEIWKNLKARTSDETKNFLLFDVNLFILCEGLTDMFTEAVCK